jgi:hypothetical protein
VRLLDLHCLVDPQDLRLQLTQLPRSHRLPLFHPPHLLGPSPPLPPLGLHRHQELILTQANPKLFLGLITFYRSC